MKRYYFLLVMVFNLHCGLCLAEDKQYEEIIDRFMRLNGESKVEEAVAALFITNPSASGKVDVSMKVKEGLREVSKRSGEYESYEIVRREKCRIECCISLYFSHIRRTACQI
ncbi:MAG: hypothetical protein HC904_14845 [Blastochloris sp.]|nr:hypothetical protein [Blastochloris sp.]